MERASPGGQKHYLLKCLDAKLGERMLAITDATTPIFDTPGNPTNSVHDIHRQAEEHGCRG